MIPLTRYSVNRAAESDSPELVRFESFETATTLAPCGVDLPVLKDGELLRPSSVNPVDFVFEALNLQHETLLVLLRALQFVRVP